MSRLSANEARELALVTIDGETIDATTTHPFYVEGYGFKPAGQLLVGEKVRLLDGVNGETGEVEAVVNEHLEEPVRVYNFEGEDWHTYYVAKLVHNQGCDSITVQGLIDSSIPGRETKGRTAQYNRIGNYQDAKKDFNKHNPQNVTEMPNGKGYIGALMDGIKVNVRNVSSEGSPTIEIQNSYKDDDLKSIYRMIVSGVLLWCGIALLSRIHARKK